MKTKRVIFICNFAAGYGGNFLASLKALSCFLTKKGILIKYVFPQEAQLKKWEVDLNGFTVDYVDMDGKTLKKYIRQEIKKSDIIYGHFLSSSQILAIKKGIGKKRKYTHFIIHEHMDLDPIHGKLYQVLKVIFCKLRLNKLFYIGVSPTVYQRLCKIYGKKNVFLVENAISFTRLNTKSTNPFNHSTKKHIIIFGTDYKRKGVDIAIKAIQQDPDLRSKIELDIIASNIKYTRKKILYQFDKGVFSFVKIMPVRHRVQDLYNNASIFISPSRHEAFGYANLEAAYCGTQVIASDVPGQNTLKEVPYIKWIEKENIAQLNKAINELLNKTLEMKRNEAKANRIFIMQNYSLENWVRKIYLILKKVTNK